MEHSYKPLSTVELPKDQDVVTDGLFETGFDQYESAIRLHPPSRRASINSTNDQNTTHQNSTAATTAFAATHPPAFTNAQDNATLSSDYHFLTIPTITGKGRDPSPSRSPSPSFPFERCATPNTVQDLLQQDPTLDYTQSEEYGSNVGDLWQSNGEMRPLSSWQRIRRPLARGLGIITAIVLSGCAGEMCALGSVWRGTATAVAAFIALVLDALWAAEALASVAGPPAIAFGAIRRAARRARTPFYAIVALLLIVEGVGVLRWVAVALSILAAGMRAAAWCGQRTLRTGLLLPHNRSFTAPTVHYDAQFAQRADARSYSPAPMIRTPMPSYPGTPTPSRPREAYPHIPGTPVLLRPITPAGSRAASPLPPGLGTPNVSRPGTPVPTAMGASFIIGEATSPSPPPLMRL